MDFKKSKVLSQFLSSVPSVQASLAKIVPHNIMLCKVATDRVLQFKMKKHNIILTNIMYRKFELIGALIAKKHQIVVIFYQIW